MGCKRKEMDDGVDDRGSPSTKRLRKLRTRGAFVRSKCVPPWSREYNAERLGTIAPTPTVPGTYTPFSVRAIDTIPYSIPAPTLSPQKVATPTPTRDPPFLPPTENPSPMSKRSAPSTSSGSDGMLPKKALHALYGKLPDSRQMQGVNFHTFSTGPGHSLLWTSIFVCPIQGEIFLSSRYGNDIATQTGGFVWYKKKTHAEHGAAATAHDCLLFRANGVVGLPLSHSAPYGEEDPRASMTADDLDQAVPADVREKVREQRARIRGDTGNRLPTSHATPVDSSTGHSAAARDVPVTSPVSAPVPAPVRASVPAPVPAPVAALVPAPAPPPAVMTTSVVGLTTNFLEPVNVAGASENQTDQGGPGSGEQEGAFEFEDALL